MVLRTLSGFKNIEVILNLNLYVFLFVFLKTSRINSKSHPPLYLEASNEPFNVIFFISNHSYVTKRMTKRMTKRNH